MNDKINIAVLGCSSVATRSVIPAILRCREYKLTHVASRSEKKARKLAERIGCSVCGYSDLIKDRNIDAVYVSLPVSLHYEWGKKVVQSGKHLLLEKTFTDEFDKAREIISLAEQKNLIAMEALMYVYHPLYRKVRSLIFSGEIGDIIYIEAHFGFPFLPKDNIRNKLELGGGAILDNLIYPLSFCLNVIKTPPKSYSCNIFRDEGQSVDSRGFVQMSWDDCVAQIAYGFGFSYRNSYLVWGNKGYISAERVFSRPPEINGKIVILKQDMYYTITVEAEDHFLQMMNAFSDKISGKDNSSINEKENILTRMRIISHIRKEYMKSGEKNVQF